MIRGQCLCGAVQYQYTADIREVILCFCQHCQQAQGSLMAWNSPIDARQFSLLSGANLLKTYFHTEGKARVFCMNCGSPIYSYRENVPNVLRLRLGTVTEGDIAKITECIYTEHQPDFIQIKLDSEE